MPRTRLAAAGLLALAAGSAAADVTFSVDGTDVQIYGYLMAKAAFDLEENLGTALGTVPSNVALSGTVEEGRHGHWHATANQTRIGFRSERGEVATHFEGDFAPGTFRLRHAYFTHDKLLVGQTMSNFYAPIADMPAIDFEGLVGTTGIRLPQIRYDLGAVSVSLETPGASFLVSDAEIIREDAVLLQEVESEDSWPRLTASYDYERERLALTLAAAVQGVEYRAPEATDTEAGYGVLLAAAYGFEPITVRGNVNYTNGLNTLVVGLYGDDAFVTAAGTIDRVDALSGTLSVSVPVGPGEFSAGYGHIEIDYPRLFPDRDKTLRNALVNYLWSVDSQITYGVEFGWYYRKTVAGHAGKAPRLAFSGAYAF